MGIEYSGNWKVRIYQIDIKVSVHAGGNSGSVAFGGTKAVGLCDPDLLI